MNFEIAPKSTEIESNWDDARLYCFALNIDGKTGWRLPTKDELSEICESDHDFETHWCFYWSSTELNSYLAWYQNFSIGWSNYTNKIHSRNYLTRAVRDLS